MSKKIKQKNEHNKEETKENKKDFAHSSFQGEWKLSQLKQIYNIDQGSIKKKKGGISGSEKKQQNIC